MNPKFRYVALHSILVIVFITVFFGPQVVLGQVGGNTSPCPKGEICNPLKVETLSGFIEKALEVVRNIAFLVAVFFIVYAGYLFVTARGVEDRLKKAKGAFLWGVVGAAVILGAQLFANALQGTVTNLGG